MKVAATVQYDGRAFSGFQVQKNSNTVQAELEKAISTIQRQPVKVLGSGRTDSGVHSWGQVIHFDIEKLNQPLSKFIYAINAVLPAEISLVHAAEVPPDFHARFSCTGREYIYQVLNSRYRMALFQHNTFWMRKQLDQNAIKEAADYLVGEHDFAAFTQAVYAKEDEVTIRRIDEIKLIQKTPLLLFHYRASGFLHNMIRIMTGTLLQAGRGELKPTDIKHILESKDRKKAGVTLPGRALYFYRAHYQDYETPREVLPYEL